MAFTVVVKEVRLMAQSKGARIHKYLDDWLVKATSRRTCLQHTQTLVDLCQELDWIVNIDKSELEPKQAFDFLGYQFDLKEGEVNSNTGHWQTLNLEIQKLVADPTCWVQQFMSPINLFTATEKQVHPCRFHVKPIQWHLKNTGGS